MTKKNNSTEPKEKKHPPLSHACVGAIVYRNTKKGKEYLIQKRDKPGTPYDEKWEFPVGILEDSPDQRKSAFVQVLNEVQEEAGINPDNATVITENKSTYQSPEGDVVEGFTPYFQTHQLVGENPWYMTTFLVEVDTDASIVKESDETKEVQWIEEKKLKKMVTDNPEDFFSLQVPALQFHFDRSS